MAVLIAGVGLLGSQVAAKLVEQGEKVILYDLDYDMDSLSVILDMNQVKTVVGDILDLPLLVDTIRREGVDRIIQTASLLFSAVSSRPYTGVKVNIEGTLNVLEAAKITNLKRVVFTSSGMVGFGTGNIPSDTPQEEDFSMRCLSQRPPNVYGITKLTSEYLGLTYCELYGVDFVALRVSGLFGPRKKTPSGLPSRTIDLFVKNAAFGKPVVAEDPTLVYSGVQDYLYSKDGAKACLLACFAKKPVQRVYNITCGKGYSFQDLIETTKKVFPGTEVELKVTPRSGLSGIFPLRVGRDISKAQNELGYQPDFDLETAFRDYGQWLRLNVSS